jgi:mannitol 2-dehydrogenase
MKQSLFNYVSKTEPDLLDWISKTLVFQIRWWIGITPITNSKDIQTLKEDFLLMINCLWFANFSQWVIEDKYSMTNQPGIKLVYDTQITLAHLKI